MAAPPPLAAPDLHPPVPRAAVGNFGGWLVLSYDMDLG